MVDFASRFLFDDSAATAIEYGLVAGGIALAIVTAIVTLSEAVKGDFDLVAEAFP